MTRDPNPVSFCPLKHDELHVLLALADQPRHGYGIMQDAHVRSDGAVRLQTGALYRAIKQLLTSELIEECEAPDARTGDDERRRYYQLTRLGRAVLGAEADRLSRLARALRLASSGKRARLA